MKQPSGARASLETNNPCRRFSDVIFFTRVDSRAHTEQCHALFASSRKYYTLVVVASQSEAHESFLEKAHRKGWYQVSR